MPFINIDDVSTSLLRKGFSKFELTGIHNNLDIFGQHFPDILIMNIFLQKKAKQVADKTQASTKFKQLGG